MLLKVGAILAAPLVLMSVVVGATGLVVVDVREGGPDGHHFFIPVPLIMAQAALALAPEEAKYVDCPELAPYYPIAERVLKELREQPDFTMVEVKDGDETVLVRKVKDTLRVDVIGDDEEVHCSVPLKNIMKVLESYDGNGFSTRAALSALRGTPRGQIVHVRDGDEEVKIRIF